MTWPLALALCVALGYTFGDIPFAYIIVKAVKGEDVTEHGTGNVGAMNVRRTTGSWAWFVVAMALDVLKGMVPALLARQWLGPALGVDGRWAAEAAAIGAIVGHNWPLTMLAIKKRMVGGKGLATGGGAVFAVDPLYALVPLATALMLIAFTRTLLVGQIGAAVVFPLLVMAYRPADLAFALVAAGLVGYKHARRVPGLVAGREPRWNVTDERGRENPG